jgi:hypothetical protein
VKRIQINPRREKVEFFTSSPTDRKKMSEGGTVSVRFEDYRAARMIGVPRQEKQQLF